MEEGLDIQRKGFELSKILKEKRQEKKNPKTVTKKRMIYPEKNLFN